MFKSLRSFASLVLFCLFLLLLNAPVSAQATSLAQAFIREINAEAFPEMAVIFRAINGDNSASLALSPEEIALYDNGVLVENVQIQASDRTPVHTIFVIDSGTYARFVDYEEEVLRDALMAFLEGSGFRDGVDSVTVLGTTSATANNTTTLLPVTQQGADFSRFAGTFEFDAVGNPNGLFVVESGMDVLNRVVDEEGLEGAAIVYLGGLIDRITQSQAARDATQLSTEAKANNIRIHVISTRTDYETPLRNLTEESGGQYYHLQADGNNTNALQRIYTDIQQQGAAYEASYRAPSAESGTHQVAIVPVEESAENAARTAAYVVEAAVPTIEITTPADGADFRRNVIREGNTLFYDLDSITVTARLALPDNRIVEAAELVVDGVTKLTTEPDPTSGRMQFAWDITDIETEGANPKPIKVRIRDEFGNEFESPTITTQVLVEPGMEIPPTNTPMPTPTPVPPRVTTACEIDPNSPDCIGEWATRIIPWVGFAIMAILAVILFINRRKVADVGGRAYQAVANEVRKTLLGGSGGRGQTVLATFEVLMARRDLVGQEIKIYTHTTTFGRDPKLCDVQLYDEDENSTVSGLHCTLQYDKNRGVFMLTDDNSTAGTVVNGKAIRPNDPIELEDGDEIRLGDPFRRGARLLFKRTIGTDSDDAAVTTYEPLKTIFDDEQHILFEEEDSNNKTIVEDGDSYELPELNPEDRTTLTDLPDDDEWLNQLN